MHNPRACPCGGLRALAESKAIKGKLARSLTAQILALELNKLNISSQVGPPRHQTYFGASQGKHKGRSKPHRVNIHRKPCDPKISLDTTSYKLYYVNYELGL